MLVSQKLSILRSKMSELGIGACIIPNSDPHMSEYTASHWKVRDYISGFTGSAGTIVIMLNDAGLWTDGRYYLQASIELADTGITLFKAAEPETITFVDWIIQNIGDNKTVAVNGELFSVDDMEMFAQKFNANNIKIKADEDLAAQIWDDREAIPNNQIFVHETKYAGLSRTEKIAKVRSYMKQVSATNYIVAALDEIAWVLNLRGNDVSYNPVFHSYVIISDDKVNLFLDSEKIPQNVANELQADGITLYEYADIFSFVQNLPHGSSVMFDRLTTNSKVYAQIPSNVIKIDKPSIVKTLKGIKNATEQNGFRMAMERDGVAMVKFLHWLENAVPQGGVTELSAAQKIRDIRAEGDNFMDESFCSISGFAGHGAIIHYRVTEETDVALSPDNFYLIDSGGQYLEGTTDITRTIHLGTPTEQQKTDFTLVLKGNIALSMCVFPKGTRGVHLDSIARKALWANGMNYGHGTGHGVGCFLNVHEGPQHIRPNDNGIIQQVGMVTSNEPGLYRNGEYGIRVENLILTVDAFNTEFGEFMKFETLTLCPIDIKSINAELLSCDEKQWLNNYHATVYKKLSPLLSDELQQWLRENTKAI